MINLSNVVELAALCALAVSLGLLNAISITLVRAMSDGFFEKVGIENHVGTIGDDKYLGYSFRMVGGSARTGRILIRAFRLIPLVFWLVMIGYATLIYGNMKRFGGHVEKSTECMNISVYPASKSGVSSFCSNVTHFRLSANSRELCLGEFLPQAANNLFVAAIVYLILTSLFLVLVYFLHCRCLHVVGRKEVKELLSEKIS